MPPRPLAQKAAAQDEDRSDQYRDEGQQTMLSTQRQPHPDAEEQVDELLGSLDGSSETRARPGLPRTTKLASGLKLSEERITFFFSLFFSFKIARKRSRSPAMRLCARASWKM